MQKKIQPLILDWIKYPTCLNRNMNYSESVCENNVERHRHVGILFKLFIVVCLYLYFHQILLYFNEVATLKDKH